MRKPKPSAKEREVAGKPRRPQARRSADRPLRHAAPSARALLPERQARHLDRRALVPPAFQGEPGPLVMWRVYKHPKDYPGEYVARKFVITEDFYGPTYEFD